MLSPDGVNVPFSLDPGQLIRVLLALHGQSGSGPDIAQRLQGCADQHGWLLIAPTMAYRDYLLRGKCGRMRKTTSRECTHCRRPSAHRCPMLVCSPGCSCTASRGRSNGPPLQLALSGGSDGGGPPLPGQLHLARRPGSRARATRFPVRRGRPAGGDWRGPWTRRRSARSPSGSVSEARTPTPRTPRRPGTHSNARRESSACTHLPNSCRRAA